MKKILIDSSVWISYFKNKKSHTQLDKLILNNQICTNELILTELIPFLKMKKHNELINLLLELPKKSIKIDWDMIINYQITNLKNGINNVGIPDLIILDHVVSNNLILYTENKHFKLIRKQIHFSLLDYHKDSI